MPRKKKLQQEIAEAIHAAPPLPAGVVEQLVTGPMTAGQLEGMFRQLKKAVVERSLGRSCRITWGLSAARREPGPVETTATALRGIWTPTFRPKSLIGNWVFGPVGSSGRRLRIRSDIRH